MLPIIIILIKNYYYRQHILINRLLSLKYHKYCHHWWLIIDESSTYIVRRMMMIILWKPGEASSHPWQRNRERQHKADRLFQKTCIWWWYYDDNDDNNDNDDIDDIMMMIIMMIMRIMIICHQQRIPASVRLVGPTSSIPITKQEAWDIIIIVAVVIVVVIIIVFVVIIIFVIIIVFLVIIVRSPRPQQWQIQQEPCRRQRWRTQGRRQRATLRLPSEGSRSWKSVSWQIWQPWDKFCIILNVSPADPVSEDAKEEATKEVTWHLIFIAIGAFYRKQQFQISSTTTPGNGDPKISTKKTTPVFE